MAAPYLKHTTLAVLPSAGDGEIANTQWNENHTLTLSANGLLGRSHATDANVAEISVGSTLTLSGNTLSVNVAGSNTYVLYHDNGALGANINFQFDPATSTLKLGALSPVNVNAVANLTINTDLVFFDTTNNRLGVGTSTPEATVSIRSQGTSNRRGLLLQHSDNTTAFSQAKFAGARSRGSHGSPSAVLADDSLVSFNAAGYKATEWSNTVGGMYVYASQNWTDTATGTYITFRGPANNTTTVTERFRIGHQAIEANGVLTVTANLVAQAQSSFVGAAVFSNTISVSGKATFVATATGAASINLPHGTAPSAPANGDVWTTTAGIYVHVNGTTVGPLSAGGGAGESFHPFLLMGA